MESTNDANTSFGLIIERVTSLRGEVISPFLSVILFLSFSPFHSQLRPISCLATNGFMRLGAWFARATRYYDYIVLRPDVRRPNLIKSRNKSHCQYQAGRQPCDCSVFAAAAANISELFSRRPSHVQTNARTYTHSPTGFLGRHKLKKKRFCGD